MTVYNHDQRQGSVGDQPRGGTRAGDRLSTLLEAMADAVLTVDLTGRIVHLNPAAAALLGAQHEELRGRSLEDLMSHEPPGSLAQTLSGLRDGDSTRRMEVDVKSGATLVPAEISITRLPPAAGPEAFIVTIEPISEHRLVEAALASNARLLELANDAILIQ